MFFSALTLNLKPSKPTDPIQKCIVLVVYGSRVKNVITKLLFNVLTTSILRFITRIFSSKKTDKNIRKQVAYLDKLSFRPLYNSFNSTILDIRLTSHALCRKVLIFTCGVFNDILTDVILACVLRYIYITFVCTHLRIVY